MKKQTFRKSLVALAVGSVCSTAALAEDYTTGTLRGVVQNTAGNPVPNATVTVTSDKGVRRTVTANSEGSIIVPQLPIGQYTVTISKDGYNELVSSNVPIQIGSLGAFTFTMASEDETMEEIYVTGTRQGSWDFNSTTTGITVDVGEAFSQAPLGRDATSIVLLAPGTSLGDSAFSTGQYGASGNIASFAGSSVGENVYYVNGMNITNFRNFVGGSTIPFELFDQIEVKTGGYQAEFGRSTGGVTNAVTKSGSNEWDFGVNAYFSPDSLTEDSPATYANANQYDESEALEFNLWASGAIIKDKLFFFALYNPRDITEFDCGGGSCIEETNDSPFYALKLDFVPWEGHRAEYTFFSDDQTREVASWRYTQAGRDANGDEDLMANAPLSAFKGDRVSDSKYVNGGENHIFRYTAALTDWMTLSALWGENTYARSNYSDVDTPWTNSRVDPSNLTANVAVYDTGIWSVPLWEIGEDQRENLRFDADFYFELAGDHHIRVGWDQEDLTSSNESYYSGGLRAQAQRFLGTDNLLRWETRQYYNDGSFGTKQTAYYIQDSWQVLDNLTLNLGVRNETFENSNLLGEVYVETKDQVAPRLGFSWDPFNNSNSRVYGSYGHYYLPIATNTNMRLAGQEVYFREFYEAVDGDGDGYPDVDAGGYPVLGDMLGDRFYYADGTMPFAEATKATDLDPLYQSEWILGVEHTFADEWTVGIRYINRELESLIEDVAIDVGVRAWAAANGYGGTPEDEAYSGFHQYVLVNPGSTFTTAAVEDFGGDGQIDYVTITPDMLPYPKGERTYDAVDLTVERIWDEKWTFSAAYTWSESKGNYEGALKSENGQDDAGLTQDFDQPGLMDGAYGPTPNDHEHRFKMHGAYAINEQFQVNGALYYETGRKFGCIGNHPTDYFAWNYGAASWFCQGQLTPRGSQMQSDDVTQLNLSFVYTPRWSMLGDSQLMFRVDVFNVLDADASVDRWEFGEAGFTDNFHFDDPPTIPTILPTLDPNYGDTTRYQAPRSVRFGASWNF